VLQRPKIEGSGEGVIDHGDEVVLSAKTRHLIDRTHLDQWIGHAFHVESPRVFADGVGPGFGSVNVHEGDFDTVLGEVVGQQRVRPSVEAVLGQQMSPVAQHTEKCRGDGRHSAGCYERGFAVLDGGKLLMKCLVVGRVVQTDVGEIVVALFTPGFEIGRAEYRHADGATDARSGLSGVNEFGIKISLHSAPRSVLTVLFAPLQPFVKYFTDLLFHGV